MLSSKYRRSLWLMAISRLSIFCSLFNYYYLNPFNYGLQKKKFQTSWWSQGSRPWSWSAPWFLYYGSWWYTVMSYRSNGVRTFIYWCKEVKAGPWTYSSKRALRAHVITWLLLDASVSKG